MQSALADFHWLSDTPHWKLYCAG